MARSRAWLCRPFLSGEFRFISLFASFDKRLLLEMMIKLSFFFFSCLLVSGMLLTRTGCPLWSRTRPSGRICTQSRLFSKCTSVNYPTRCARTSSTTSSSTLFKGRTTSEWFAWERYLTQLPTGHRSLSIQTSFLFPGCPATPTASFPNARVPDAAPGPSGRKQCLYRHDGQECSHRLGSQSAPLQRAGIWWRGRPSGIRLRFLFFFTPAIW